MHREGQFACLWCTSGNGKAQEREGDLRPAPFSMFQVANVKRLHYSLTFHTGLHSNAKESAYAYLVSDARKTATASISALLFVYARCLGMCLALPPRQLRPVI